MPTSFLKIWFPKYFEYTYGIDTPNQAILWLASS